MIPQSETNSSVGMLHSLVYVLMTASWAFYLWSNGKGFCDDASRPV